MVSSRLLRLLLILLFLTQGVSYAQYKFQLRYGKGSENLAAYYGRAGAITPWDSGYIVAGNLLFKENGPSGIAAKVQDNGTGDQQFYNSIGGYLYGVSAKHIPGHPDQIAFAGCNTFFGLPLNVNNHVQVIDYPYYANIYFALTETDGSIIHSIAIGRSGSADTAYAVVKTSDGGYAMTGTTSPVHCGVTSTTNMFVCKLDSHLNLQWSYTLGDSTGLDAGRCIMETQNGTLIAAGFSNSLSQSGGDSDILLASFELSNGAPIQTRVYGKPADEAAFGICEDPEGRILLTGYYQEQTRDFFILRLHPSLDIDHFKTYDFWVGETAYAIQYNPNLNFYQVAGVLDAYLFGGTDAFMVSVDTSMEVEPEASKIYGGRYDDVLNSIAYHPGDRSTYLSGTTSSYDSIQVTSPQAGYQPNPQMYVIKTDTFASTACIDVFFPPDKKGRTITAANRHCTPVEFGIADLNNTSSSLYPYMQDSLICKEDFESSQKARGQEVQEGAAARLKPDAPSGQAEQLTLYPNPASGWCKLQYTGAEEPERLLLTDLQGRMLRSMAVDSREIDLRLDGLTAGIYGLAVQLSDGRILHKRLLIK